VAVDHYNQIVLDALKQVADQLVTLHSLDLQQVDVDQSLATARQSDALATEGFRRGLTDYLNVLNAQARLLAEEQNQQRLQARRLDAYAGLMAALGGGVLDASNPSPPLPATSTAQRSPAAGSVSGSDAHPGLAP